VLALFFPVFLAAAVEVERVLALVNGVPVLQSDVDLAEVAALVPRQPGESDTDYQRAVVDALVDLELRWQDLEAAAISSRVAVDLDAAWRATLKRVGGEEELRRRLAGIGLDEPAVRGLVRRAAIVEAYVSTRFGPFVRPTAQEVEKAWQEELVPKLRAAGKPVVDLSEVRGQVEALLRERKLTAEVGRWTSDLAKRAEIVMYAVPAPSPMPPPSATPTSQDRRPPAARVP
jgi:hypothetical protein